MVTLMTTESNYISPPLVSQTTAFDDTATQFSKKRRRVENEAEQQPALKTLNQATHGSEAICMNAPDFNCAAVFNNQIHRLQLSCLLSRHKAVVLFFYECDFTPSACKDLTQINDTMSRFNALNTMPLAISTDTEMVHTAFMKQQSNFVPSFPLVADTSRAVSRYFDVINSKTGLARRAAFIIDGSRQVRFSFVLEDIRILHSMDTICSILQTI